jgi:predicted nucleic acid-binding protein
LKPVLLDTGVVVALLDRSERYHEACSDCVRNLAALLVTCEAVIAESCYLLRHLRGAADAILENLETGAFQIPLSISRSAPQLRRIFRKYRDREVDLADACLVHLADELRCGDILTLDRDFEVYRWGGNRRFRILIPLRRFAEPWASSNSRDGPLS